MSIDDRLREHAARWNAASPPPPDLPASFGGERTADVVTVVDSARTRGRRRRGRPRLVLAAAVGAVLVGGIGFVAVETAGGDSPVRAVAPVADPSPSASVVGLTPYGQLVPVGERRLAPDVAGPLLTGDTWSLSAQRGKVVVLTVLGSWCGPCREYAPTLGSLAGPDVVVAGVAYQDDEPKLRVFVADAAITYPVVVDGGLSVADLPLGSGLPETLLVDREGRLAATYPGANARPDLDAAVAALRAE